MEDLLKYYISWRLKSLRYKNVAFILAIAVIWMLTPLQAIAAVNVYANGQQVNFDSPPIVDASANRTLVPFRQIFEVLGAEVWYDSVTNSSFGKKDNMTIQLPVNEKVAYKNDELITLDVASQVVNGRTMVPLRFISETLGCTVETQNTSSNLEIYIKTDNLQSNMRMLTNIKTDSNDLNFIVELEVEDGVNIIHELVNPERLAIDLQNTNNNARDILDLNSPLVSSIRTSQYSSTTTRVVLDLKKDVDYHLEQNKDSLVVNITESKQPQSSEPPQQETPGTGNKLIILDAGHGGSDTGAVGYSGKYEKDLVLQITDKLKTALENSGYSVMLTRSDDTFVSLENRVIYANNTNAFAFVSIHANSFSGPSAQGLEVYTMYGADHSLAQAVLDSILAKTGQINRKVKEAGYYVIKYTKMSSILIETGFISNPQEEAFLWNEENQNKIVQGIVEGIKKYHP
ncbi:N-acetylmuramoyl-L-alanine amidase family protein [Desulfotruncus arcticus]|nr:N-acetylmuramoyl-L-alanine amidase family protein [Desulfotruncus arcticus]